MHTITFEFTRCRQHWSYFEPKEAQEAEEARPPFVCVDLARAFITNEKPDPTDNIRLEMCMLGAEEQEKCYRYELIDRADEQDFDQLAQVYKSLDFSRRSKFISQLTIWKNRNELRNNVNYREGFSYRFKKVHSLKLLYGNPVGSMQIREHLRAVPLPPTGFDVNGGGQQPRDGSVASGAGASPRSFAQEPNANDVDTPSRESEDDLASVTPSAKTLSKRKTRKDDGKDGGKVLTFESPTKKTRKSTSKASLAASPTNTTSA